MIPYATIKLTEFPDMHDIQREGRKSREGRVKRDHGYTRRQHKHTVRRALKRSDRARSLRTELNLVRVEEEQQVAEFIAAEQQFQLECNPVYWQRFWSDIG